MGRPRRRTVPRVMSRLITRQPRTTVAGTARRRRRCGSRRPRPEGVASSRYGDAGSRRADAGPAALDDRQREVDGSPKSVGEPGDESLRRIGGVGAREIEQDIDPSGVARELCRDHQVPVSQPFTDRFRGGSVVAGLPHDGAALLPERIRDRDDRNERRGEAEAYPPGVKRAAEVRVESGEQEDGRPREDDGGEVGEEQQQRALARSRSPSSSVIPTAANGGTRATAIATPGRAAPARAGWCSRRPLPQRQRRCRGRSATARFAAVARPSARSGAPAARNGPGARRAPPIPWRRPRRPRAGRPAAPASPSRAPPRAPLWV